MFVTPLFCVCQFFSSVTHLMVRSWWAAEWAQGVFPWCRGCVVAHGLGLRLSRGCWVSGRPLPLGGACGNVPVVDTGHICDLLPSWRQVRVRLEWLLTPDIWWANTRKKMLICQTGRLLRYFTYKCILTTFCDCTRRILIFHPHSYTEQ